MSVSSAGSKYTRLLEKLGSLESVVIGFSGGVDSTFLLHASQIALGENVLAVTLVTPYIPRWEIQEAKALAQRYGIRHLIIDLDFPEAVRQNPVDRCYLCKKILFSRLQEVAFQQGISHVVDGTNVDDLQDYRPGLKALKELQIISPLCEAGLSKEDIRKLSREKGLPTWSKPSFACLMSRIPHDTAVTEEELRKIEAAERYLMQLGFAGVRVRSHGDLARIEVAEDTIEALLHTSRKKPVKQKLQTLGYRYVTVDLGGYKMGSLNPQTADKTQITPKKLLNDNE